MNDATVMTEGDDEVLILKESDGTYSVVSQENERIAANLPSFEAALAIKEREGEILSKQWADEVMREFNEK